MSDTTTPPNALQPSSWDRLSRAGKLFRELVTRVHEKWSRSPWSQDERQSDDVQIQNAESAARLEQLLALQSRAGIRMGTNAIAEQLSIELVMEGAARYIEEDPDNEAEQEIDPDWLRRFFTYAANVDEATILDVFSKALANAAIKGKPVLPPRALDALRFFEPHSYEMFLWTARLITLFGHSEPQLLLERATAEMEKPNARKYRLQDLELLEELGLVKMKPSYYTSAQIGPYYITFSYDIGTTYQFEKTALTQIGAAILSITDKVAFNLAENLGEAAYSSSHFDQQLSLGISVDRVRSLARKLLAQVSDAPEVEIQIKQGVAGGWHQIGRIFRKEASQPFELASNLPSNLVAPGTELLREFVEIFEDFDKNTLPAMGLGQGGAG